MELTDKVHEILQHRFKMAVSWYRNCDIHACGEESPHEPRNPLGPSAHHLHGERYRVYVRTVVCHNRQSKDDETEFAEAAKVWEENGGQDAASARVVVTL